MFISQPRFTPVRKSHHLITLFRMAAILQGVKKRALDGNASDPERGLRLGELVPLYAEAGLEALDERP